MSITIDNVEVTEEQLGGVITAQRGHTQALAFARKGGEGLSHILQGIWKAKAAERQGPLAIFCYLLNHYTADERASIPVVGSKKGETGNHPYDHYTTKVKTAEGERSIPASWYTDTIRATAEFDYLSDVIDYCDGLTETRPAGIPDNVQPKTVAAAELKKDMQKAKSDMRSGFVRGCQLFLHSENISGINPDRIKVKMPFRKDATSDEIVVGGSNNVRLVDPMESGEDERILTVSEFLALDPAKLVGPGKDQTLTTLMATKARAPRGTKKSGKGAAEIKVPAQVEPFLNLCNVLATALDNGTDQGRNLESQLLSRFAAKGSNADDAIMTVGTVCMAFDNLWSLIQDRYNQIAAAKAAAANTKAGLERAAKTN